MFNNNANVFGGTLTVSRGEYGIKNTGYLTHTQRGKTHWARARGGKCAGCKRKLYAGQLVLKTRKMGKFCNEYNCGLTLAAKWGVK